MMLGKKAARHDAGLPRLGAFLRLHEVAGVPLDVSPPAVETWGLYANDRVADCTVAAAAHMIVGWRALEKTQKPPPTDDEVVALYRRLAGENDEEGATALDALNLWRTVGLSGDTVVGYAAISPASVPMVRTVVWQFGGLYLGLALPSSAQTQWESGDPWTLVNGPRGERGSWGGHAVNVVGYDPGGLCLVSWGRLQRMSWEFLAAYGDEAFAVLDTDEWLGDVPGLDSQGLAAALAAL
jgi:hypothetical protein